MRENPSLIKFLEQALGCQNLATSTALRRRISRLMFYRSSLLTQALTEGAPASASKGMPPLGANEVVLSMLEVDLDTSLQYASSTLLLTSERMISDSDGARWTSWPLNPALSLQHTDHAGIGTLSLHDENQCLASWRFTLSRDVAAARLLQQFDRVQASRAGEVESIEEHAPLCPSCQAQLPEDSEQCPVCHRELLQPISTWVLFRLWRFAKPYKMQLLLGFMLTLASTAATLVPPYLSMPLMDEILIPTHNGTQIDTADVMLYLVGLFGAAITAWGLGWWRTYLLALVSERIGADLRTATFEHLLKLSLEYFGAKRTGDLIARIGNESDRICVFLSLHALDFATDVLMLIMTAIVLFTINKWLALAALLPLPIIAWMIHLVRDR